MLLSSGSASGFSVTIRVDENGNGQFTNSNGFMAPLPFAIIPDPGPGGLPATLTYDLLNPPGLTSGDVLLLSNEPGLGLAVLDIIRFNANEPTPSGMGALVFYSDNTDGFDSLADTPTPPQALYPNNIIIPEVGPEGANGATYTPTAGQPGFVAGAGGPVTYVITSDSPATTPEPSSIYLLGGTMLGLLGYGVRRWKSRA
jgi:hypothetical protein